MTDAVNILILGASYGLLPGVKLSLAGHAVTFVGRSDEIALMAQGDVSVTLPLRAGGRDIVLSAPVTDHASPGRVSLTTPDKANPADFEFVILAMQEPQYADPAVAGLMAKIAAARLPCLSIMNLPPPPFLARLGIDVSSVSAGAYASASVWDGFDPDRLTLASPDPQAIRPDPSLPGQLLVTLASNFKAAPFALEEDQALLQRLASDMSHLKVGPESDRVRPPIALLASTSIFAPLAKWPMLIAGNCRCVQTEDSVTIAQAVHADRAASAALYDQVVQLALKLGAAERTLVTFDAYADAAIKLTRPSSLARALDAGMTRVERIDRLVRNLMVSVEMPTTLINPIVMLIDQRLIRNSAPSPV